MRTRSIASLIFSIIGFTFSLSMQSMAYLKDGTMSMEWYWVGAILSYLFALISVFFIYNFIGKKKNTLDSFLIIFSTILMWATIFWTTIVIILWQAEF